MREEQRKLALGPARLLLLVMFAALCGCLLFLFLSASPASAEESPHNDPGILEGATIAISQVDEQITSGVATVAAALPEPTRMVATRAAAKLTTTVTTVATQLTTNATELVFTLPIPELVGAEFPDTHPAAAAEPQDITNDAAVFVTSRLSAVAAEEATVGVKPVLPPRPMPANDPPVAPGAIAALTGSSSSAGGGGSMFAVTNERDWTQLLSSGMSSNSDDPAPSSSNDGSDPAPD